MQAAAVVDLTVVLLPLSGLHGDNATHADHTHHYMDHTHHMSQAYKLTSGRHTDQEAPPQFVRVGQASLPNPRQELG